MNSDLDFGKRSVRIRVVEKWIIKIKDVNVQVQEMEKGAVEC